MALISSPCRHRLANDPRPSGRGKRPSVEERSSERNTREVRPSAPSGQHLLGGGLRILIAEGLFLPTGLVLAAFLTRNLGPHGYGLFTLATSITTWVCSGVNGTFSRATVRCVSEGEDWRSVSATVLRLYGGVSVSAAILLWFGASFVASLYDEPELTFPLQLLAFDIPIFCFAQAHRSILIGIGGFRQRAWLSVTRLVAKFVLIIGLVACGLSLTGAVLGSLGASFAELCVSRFFIRPSLFAARAFPLRKLWVYAGPLSLTALSFSLYGKMDVLLLKSLGVTTAHVGFYGAAQNIASVPSLFPVAFSGVLLSSLSRWWRLGDIAHVQSLGRDALRAVLILLPIAAITAGASEEIVTFALGVKFLPAAPLLAVLILGAFAMMFVSVGLILFTASGNPRWSVFLAGPLVVIVFFAHLIVIPLLGAIGAALVSCGGAMLCALTALTIIARQWRIVLPFHTCWRSLVVCTIAYGAALAWPTSSFGVLCKLPLLFLGCLGLFAVLGEFTANEKALGWAILKGVVRSRNG
jgi:O-antigen/teichoic acid export membrane protein